MADNKALAIAYSIRRKNAPKMAKGGYPVPKDPNYAFGGEAGEEHLSSDERGGDDSDEIGKEAYTIVHPENIAKMIRNKMHGKYPQPHLEQGMAAGGEVDGDFLSDEEDTALPDESASPEDRKKRLLSKAFEMVRARHTK